jgi:YD repeat-containing protein
VLDELERKVRDLAAVQLELAHETLALAERHALHYDELDRLADHLHAEAHDAVVLERGNE